ncbi:MAG: hypothetical protein KBF21_00245 [Thermoanaerobaculia bacterium]|jgi:hypothetical protein|nr:hypothetical protein [Thermoanaerobaculia bacterium]MBP9822625.1 hypothetical protein [Thermoanaerobaculia bacterium]
MRFLSKWVLATFSFILLGAVFSALVYLVTGLPVLSGDDVFDDGPLLGAELDPTAGHAASAALDFAVVRSPEALLFGLAWAFCSKQKLAVLVAGAVALPLAFEVLFGLFPLSASWVGDLAVSIYYYRQPPEYVLPLRYTARVALSFLGPPLLASLLSLVLLSRIERRVPYVGGKATG